MTTSHTAILEAEDGTFEEFVWSCARAIDFNCRMRDDDPGIPIQRYETSAYELEALAAAKQKLRKYESMPWGEAAALLDEQHARFVKQWEEAGVHLLTLRTKLESARKKALAWNPPTKDHEGLKRYMLEQIDGELKYADLEAHTQRKPARDQGDVRSWLARKVEFAQEDVKRCQERYDEDLARTQEANDWNDALAKSVTPVFKRR